MRTRHLRYYPNLAEQADAALRGPDQPPTPTQLQAQAWKTGMGMLLGDDIDPRGASQTVLNLYDNLPDPLPHPTHLARARWFLAYAQLGYADQQHRKDRLHHALTEFQTLNDDWGIAACHLILASCALLQSDLPQFRHHSTRSLTLFTRIGDGWGQAEAMHLMGTLAEITGDYPQATQWRRDAQRIAERLHLWPLVAQTLAELGRLALLTGDFTTADDLHEQARRLAAEQSDKQTE